MGDLIELSYRRFSRHLIEALFRAGYLRYADRHKLGAVTRAWTRAKQDIDKRIAGRPGRPQ